MADVDNGIGATSSWPSFLTEIWALSAVAMALIFVRWIVRVRTVGFRGFQGDDYVSIGTLAFVLMDAATVTVATHKGQNVQIVEADLPNLTQADIARLTYGSKVEFSAWCSYATLIYCLKFTMLFFYKRLTLGSFHAKLVKILFWVVGISYIANMMVIIFGCFPTQMNWQVSPIAPWKCTYRPQNFIGTAVFNIVTDSLLLAIPVPMLWKLKMPLRKKLVIGLILSSGLFVIATAIIRVVLAFASAPSAASINRWGVRETVIGCFTVNIPILRPMFTRAFWVWGPYDPTAISNNKSYPTNGGTHGQSVLANRSRMAAGDVDQWKGDIELGNTANISGGAGDSREGMKKGMIMQTRVIETTDNDEQNLLFDEDKSQKSV